MIRASKLVVSRPMYAFVPGTLTGVDWEFGGHRTVAAVWFRRKKGALVASMGTYDLSVGWGRAGDTRSGRPVDTFDAWVAAHADNRYGGRHLASWDGAALLCSDQPVSPGVAQERVVFLSAMLAGFPDPPAGYDGWWTSPRGGVA